MLAHSALYMRPLYLVPAIGIVSFLAAGCQVAQSPSTDSRIGTQRQSLAGTNGIESNGIQLNGIQLNGIQLNGIQLNGIQLNGIQLNGIQLNGIQLNGIQLNGIHLNGIQLNGIQLNGIQLNGIQLNGIQLNGIQLNGLTFHREELSAQEYDDFKEILPLLVDCALPAGQCINGTDEHGAPFVHCGSQGLDPGWKDGEPDLSQSEVIAQCVIDGGAAAEPPLAIGHAPVVQQGFKTLLKYMVECALPAGVDVTVYDENDNPTTYSGSIGLAPEWETGALTPAGQGKVSACLAARSNALGKTNQISLRGIGLTVSALEQKQFSQHEGAFAANFFADVPYVKSCMVAGGISGRTCTSDPESCGFDPIGDCSTMCTEIGTSGTYSDCDNGAYTEIISTFLALDHSLAFGERHTCLRQLDGTVACWGNNLAGQLGNGSAIDETLSAPQVVSGLGGTADALASSYRHTCARSSDGALHCWGANGDGQIGNGATSASEPSAAAVANLGVDVAQTSVSDRTTCSVLTSGELKCWGANSYGELGIGTNAAHSTPQSVSGLVDVVKVAAKRHTCALRASGTLSCWGYNAFGQVGDGNTSNQLSPVDIFTGNAVDVCTGDLHSCAVLDNGSVQCWGRNSYGQLGDGTTTTRVTPVQVTGLGSGVKSIQCGFNHTCALRDDHTIHCWGANSSGQVGTGSFTSRKKNPVQVGGLGDAHSVLLGRNYSCAGLADGTLWCWGRNTDYQLGDGSNTNQASPVIMSYHSCGDGVCDASAAESAANCAADCAACGDGVCSGSEDCTGCQADCGECPQAPVCGNGTCETGEDCTSCPADCGACPPVCGDGACEAGEDESSCPADCQTCAAPGEYCETDADCCDNRCRERKNKCRG